MADEESDRLLLYVVFDGAMEPSGEVRFSAGSRPVGLAVHPTGRFLYVVNRGASNVAGFFVDAWSGALTPIGPPLSLGRQPEALEFDPAGQYATVAILESWDKQRFQVLPQTGEMLAQEVDANAP